MSSKYQPKRVPFFSCEDTNLFLWHGYLNGIISKEIVFVQHGLNSLTSVKLLGEAAHLRTRSNFHVCMICNDKTETAEKH